MSSRLALVAYDDLDRTVHTWARLALALGGLGEEPLFVDRLRAPTAVELARLAAARGAWAPPVEPARADGVTVFRPLDLPARRFSGPARWDRTCLETAILRHAPRGWTIVFSSALGKPWPRPEGHRLCYFPVDEFAAEDPAYARREERMLAECDLLVSVSEAVVRPRRERVRRAAVLPNGYDPELFDPTRDEVDVEVAALPGPRFGYVGTLRSSKVDLGRVERLAHARPDASFVFAGSVEEAAAAERLGRVPNVHVLEPRPREGVAAVLRALDACLLPYADTPMNRACSPLKAREALALGVPVVSTAVEELLAHPGAVAVGHSDDELLEALDAAPGAHPDPQAAAWFTGPSWTDRARQLLSILREAE